MFYGNNVSMGYASHFKDLARPDCNNGLLKTGDLASRDEDGFYYIKGRNNRYAKLYGKRINLDDVENELKNHGFINACIEKNGILKVYIELDKRALNDNLKNKISFVTAHFLKINRNIIEITLINKLPINNYGKIMYKNLL
jgi:acyl-coenzyme A synthetase/AMP-(fatty) acid ligase